MTELEAVKRLHYFDQQFLRAHDFADEQRYHVTMRRLHNQLFHTPGIASGLEVKRGSSTSVQVGPGVALDDLGREVVLPAPATVELGSAPAGKDLHLTISYDEEETDRTSETGVEGSTRWSEQAKLEVLETAPGHPGRQIVLALVAHSGADVTKLETALRRPAGIVGGALDVLRLTVRSESVAASGAVGLELETAGQVLLRGGLRVAGGLTAQQGSIRGPLSVDGAATVGGALSVGGVITAWPGAVLGQLGIGTREPKQQLHVEGDALVHRLFLGDVGHGDSWAGLGHANAASTTGYGFLQSNDGRSTLLNKRSGGGVLQLRVDNAAKVTLVDSGHLGIGTDAPAARLHVAGGAILAELGSSADAGIRFPRAKLPWPNSAYVRYFEEGGGATMLIGTDSARNRLVLEQGNRRLTLEDEVVTISSSYTSTLLDVKGQIHAQGQIHSGGQHSYPGLSFADRSTPDADVFGEVAGRRWAWYAEQGQARLWTWDAYPLIVDKFGNLTVAGDITCKSLTPGSKKLGYVADAFVNPGEHPLEEGEVVVLADAKPALFVGFEGKIPVPEVERTAKAYDTRVCGIVAEAHGEQVATSRRKNAPQELRTFTDEERDDLDTTQVGPGQAGAMVTLGAYASCKVDASYGAIEVGDLLTTSETPGHAMKASDPARATGAIIGKALAPRARGQGTIPVMVFLQ